MQNSINHYILIKNNIDILFHYLNSICIAKSFKDLMSAKENFMIDEFVVISKKFCYECKLPLAPIKTTEIVYKQEC